MGIKVNVIHLHWWFFLFSDTFCIAGIRDREFVNSSGNTEDLENTNLKRTFRESLHNTKNGKDSKPTFGKGLNSRDGKSMPENEFHGVRRKGFTAPLKTDTEFMKRIENIKPCLKRNCRASNLGQSFNRGDEIVNMEDDKDIEAIYDNMPGTLNRKLARNLKSIALSKH